MVSATDGSAFTGSVTVYVCGDAGSQGAGSVGSGACTHEGNGYHTYAPADTETNYDLIAFTFVGTGAVPATVQVFTRLAVPAVNVTQWEGHTVHAHTEEGTPTVEVVRWGGNDVAATGINGTPKVDLAGVLGTALTETAGYLAAAFKKFFNVAVASVPSADAVALEATLADMKGATFNTSTDSLEAIRDRGDAAWTSGGAAQPVPYAPTSLTMVIGNDESPGGENYTHLAAHNGTYVQVGENASTGLEVIVTRATSTGEEIPTVLRMSAYYNGTASHELAIQVYNYVAADWRTVATMRSRTDFFDYTIPLDSDNHNGSGEMKIRLKHNAGTYNASHYVRLDYVSWEKRTTTDAMAADVANILAQVNDLDAEIDELMDERLTAARAANLDKIDLESSEVAAAAVDALRYPLKTITRPWLPLVGVTAIENFSIDCADETFGEKLLTFIAVNTSGNPPPAYTEPPINIATWDYTRGFLGGTGLSIADGYFLALETCPYPGVTLPAPAATITFDLVSPRGRETVVVEYPKNNDVQFWIGRDGNAYYPESGLMVAPPLETESLTESDAEQIRYKLNIDGTQTAPSVNGRALTVPQEAWSDSVDLGDGSYPYEFPAKVRAAADGIFTADERKQIRHKLNLDGEQVAPSVEGTADRVATESAAGAIEAAALAGAAGGVPGGETDTLQINDGLGTPIPDARVWITSDAAGAVVVDGPKSSGDDGTVAFLLTHGTTYYCWRRKAGVTFANPLSFVAARD